MSRYRQADRRTGQRRGAGRAQGHDRERLVRCPSVGHRGCLQDLRRVVQGARASGAGAASRPGVGEYSHLVNTAADDTSRAKVELPREMWPLITANAVIALGYGVVAPVLPQLARHFGVSISAATFVITAFAIMRLCAAPPAGFLIQRLAGARSMSPGC